MKFFEKYFIGDTLELNWEYINTIPEFIMLEKCEQNPKWHSEGNAMVHTKKCLEMAYELLKKKIYGVDREKTLLIAVLFHDIGKCTTTKFVKDNWHSYGHEIEGEKIARRILWDEDIKHRETVCSLIRYHMDVLKIAEGKDCYQKMIQISLENRLTWEDLIFVKLCDIYGSTPANLEEQREIDCNKIQFIMEATKAMNIYNGYHIAYNQKKVFNRPYDFIDKLYPTVYVFIGLPGAGKNTFIEKNFPKDIVTVSRDDIRVELGYCSEDEKIIGTEEQENKVTEIFNSRLREAIAEGKDVVINNINLKKKYRDDYKRIVNNPNVNWVYYYIEAPTLEDNFKRREMIPPISFLSMIDKFEWPRHEEYDQFYCAVKGK